jgi:arsenate reductase
MAHGFLQSFDNRLEVASAGTEASGKLNSKAVEVMKEIGVDISHHTSDSVDLYLDKEWDYVITVCGGANENCPGIFGHCENTGCTSVSTIRRMQRERPNLFKVNITA